jgi:predicted DNA-binding protein
VSNQPAYTPTGSQVTSLAGKLARRVTPPNTGATSAAGPTPSPNPHVNSAASTPESSTAPRRDAAASTSEQESPSKDEFQVGAQRQISFTTPAGTRQRLRATAAGTGATIADTLLDAIEAAHPQLDRLLTDYRPRQQTGRLFTRSLPAPRDPDSVQVQVSVRLPSQAVDIIDRLVAEHQVANRSQLITAALEHHLDQKQVNPR